MISLTDRIKSRAIELGFCRVGIARATGLDEEGKLLREWLSRNYHGSMDWMARNSEKRVDPRKLLPNAQSVVAVAMNYFTEAEHSSESDVGKISRYAWGDDYHDIMTPRLEKLLEYVKHEVPTGSGKVYVDTGPVMDKVWAARAGIGWEGKHTNVISREFGSWIFLGEVILDIGLEYDEPAVDYCGTCTRCIDACPTQAIVEPYVLDSNLCISYLTIEHKGEIPATLASKFGNWIYGCDICQDVCPWNQKFSNPTAEVAFSPRDGNLSPQLSELAEMTEDRFREHFQGSPVKRTKHAGLLRNINAVRKNKELIVEKD
ncbi:MAG: tRNA epoxyqueuosine(34) reductase QueG [Bacteroidota bacterium]